MSKKNNYQTIGIALLPEQKKIVQEKAFQSNMTVSEYIKARIFEDKDVSKKNINQYEKDIMSVSIKIFFLLQSFIKNQKNYKSKEIENLFKEAEEFLVEKNYKTQEEFDKLYHSSNCSFAKGNL